MGDLYHTPVLGLAKENSVPFSRFLNFFPSRYNALLDWFVQKLPPLPEPIFVFSDALKPSGLRVSDAMENDVGQQSSGLLTAKPMGSLYPEVIWFSGTGPDDEDEKQSDLATAIINDVDDHRAQRWKEPSGLNAPADMVVVRELRDEKLVLKGIWYDIKNKRASTMISVFINEGSVLLSPVEIEPYETIPSNYYSPKKVVNDKASSYFMETPLQWFNLAHLGVLVDVKPKHGHVLITTRIER